MFSPARSFSRIAMAAVAALSLALPPVPARAEDGVALIRDTESEEILRKYHAAKVDKIEMNDEDTEKIIAEAISQIK